MSLQEFGASEKIDLLNMQTSDASSLESMDKDLQFERRLSQEDEAKLLRAEALGVQELLDFIARTQTGDAELSSDSAKHEAWDDGSLKKATLALRLGHGEWRLGCLLDFVHPQSDFPVIKSWHRVTRGLCPVGILERTVLGARCHALEEFDQGNDFSRTVGWVPNGVGDCLAEVNRISLAGIEQRAVKAVLRDCSREGLHSVTLMHNPHHAAISTKVSFNGSPSMKYGTVDREHTSQLSEDLAHGNSMKTCWPPALERAPGV